MASKTETRKLAGAIRKALNFPYNSKFIKTAYMFLDRYQDADIADAFAFHGIEQYADMFTTAIAGICWAFNTGRLDAETESAIRWDKMTVADVTELIAAAILSGEVKSVNDMYYWMRKAA